MALPTWLFVTRHKDRDGTTWLQPSENQAEAVEGAADQNDISIVSVGTYKLVKTHKLSVVKTLRFHGKTRRERK